MTAIGSARVRDRCELTGTVVRIEPTLGGGGLDVLLADQTGTARCTFFGRTRILGVDVGRRMLVAGRLGTFRGRRCLLNPVYELLAPSCGAVATTS